MTALIRTAEPPLRARLRLLAATATVLFATVLLLGSGASPAHAHTELLGSWPPAGVTDRAVDEVRLQFAEPLADGLAQVVVTGPEGSATAGDPVVTGAEVAVPLEALTRAGTYRVDYRVVSTDGHVVVGGYDLTVSAAAAAQARPPARERAAAPQAAPQAASRRDRAASAGEPATGPGAGARAGAATGVAAAAAGDLSTDGSLPAAGATPIASDARALAVVGGGALLLAVLLGVQLARRREPAVAGSRRTS